MRKFLLLLFMLFFCLQANASSWLQLKEKTYIDLDSIDYYIDDYDNVNYNQKTFWMKNLNDKSEYFKELEKIAGTKIWYIIDKTVINLHSKKIALVSSTAYNLDNEAIDSFSRNKYELSWHDIIPDSFGEMLYEIVKDPKPFEKIYKKQLMEKEKN